MFVFAVLTIALIGGITSSQNASAIEPIDLDSNYKLDSGVSAILPQVMDDDEKDNEDTNNEVTTSTAMTPEPTITGLTTPTTTNDQDVEIQRLQQENNDLKQQISSLPQQIEN